MLVSVTLFLNTWTDKAMGFCDAEAESRGQALLTEPIWIPKSLIVNFDDLPDFTADQDTALEIHIEQWVAEQHGLDPYCDEI